MTRRRWNKMYNYVHAQCTFTVNAYTYCLFLRMHWRKQSGNRQENNHLLCHYPPLPSKTKRWSIGSSNFLHVVMFFKIIFQEQFPPPTDMFTQATHVLFMERRHWSASYTPLITCHPRHWPASQTPLLTCHPRLTSHTLRKFNWRRYIA